MNKICFGLLLYLLATVAVSSQRIAVKSNLLYDATGTVNIGGEYAINKTMSVSLSANYNGWTLQAPYSWQHLLIQPEGRYWLRETFNEHYFGVHALYATFDVQRMSLPFFGFTRRNLYTDGMAYGGGISYGYHLYLTPKLNVEFSLGVGYLQLKYYKIDYRQAQEKNETNHLMRSYVGPTQIGISIVYIIN
ncbi:MAG: DUF3575 domain-containing protein [Tannerellaceae bacterium]|jgi:hypothetical protein|nr:DUF3575 domain-containing protein [Tannerellaceae bacterium]